MVGKRKPLTPLVVEGKRRKNNTIDSFIENNTNQSRAGTIKRIVMKNFMCHAHLEVSFSSNINYVVGQNGSGKSAILTALIVGLAGKATLTNRGSSVKTFIKTGKNSASVEITLNNEGPLSYQHNLYGSEITVIRRFTQSGSCSYKIKGASGEVISSQAKEIHSICTSLNIQIDNPICLLNQDTSRTFLNTNSALHKFILFMRATRLEDLQEEYEKVLKNKNSAMRVLKEKEVLYKELRTELKELKQKVENHRSIAELNKAVTLLQRELLWAKVEDTERELDDLQTRLNSAMEDHEKAKSEVSTAVQNKTKISENITELQNQIQELRDAIEYQNDPQRVLVHNLSELKDTAGEKQRERRALMKDNALKTGNCSIIENEIQKITTNFDSMKEEKEKRLQEMRSIEDKLKSIADLLKTSENDQFQIRNSLNRLQEEEFNLKSELRQIDVQIDNTKTKLNSFSGESSNEMSLYGRDMPRVIQAINAMVDQFTHLPRGPLGSYIKLRDKKWAVAIEGYINTTMLRAFVVDNKKDNVLLMGIFQKYWNGPSKPMVITTKFFFKVHDVAPNTVRPISNCVSIYDTLEISDPVVTNCLIDELGIESVLLMPDTDTAIELMSEARNVPRNCRQGVTIGGDRYFPDPNYRTYGSRYHTPRYLQMSTADVIRQLEEKIRTLDVKRKELRLRYTSKQGELTEHSKQMIEIEVKVTKLNRAHVRMKHEYDDLVNVTEPDVGNVGMLENELSELRQRIEQNNTVLQKIENGLKEVNVKITNEEEELEKIKHICRGYEDRIEPLERQVQDQNLRIREIDVNKNFATRKLDQFKRALQNAENLVKEKNNEVQQKTTEARTLGERLQEIRDIRTISDELTHKQRTIRQIQSDVESPEVLMVKYQKSNDKYTQATEFMKNLCENVKELQTAADKRNKYYKRTEDYFITFVRHCFEKVLEFRQFRGSMEIDMRTRKLELVVIPQQGSQGLTTTANLSGGERSFSTVAFLYSLWQCMEFPFYFLDEFDVFMDKVNRTKVMEILLHHAKSHSDLQFVFLTPQDVSFVTDKAVSIHRLDDPERAIINGN